jgi:hypothetical protein
MNNENAWYLSIWFVVLMLFIFPIVGFVLMWISPKFHIGAKIGITLLPIGIFFLMMVVVVLGGDYESTTPDTSIPSTEQVKKDTNIEQQKKPEPTKQIQQKKPEPTKQVQQKKPEVTYNDYVKKFIEKELDIENPQVTGDDNTVNIEWQTSILGWGDQIMIETDVNEIILNLKNKRPEVKDIHITVNTDNTDKYGNPIQTEVLKVYISKDTYAKINKNADEYSLVLSNLADNYWIHPDIAK